MSRVCVVSGGSSGIGRAIALAFHQQGDQVAILGRREAELQETLRLAKQERMESFSVDVTDRKKVDEILKKIATRFGRLDILINNAGTAGITSIFQEDDTLWEKILQTNLTSLLYLTRAFLRDGGKKAGAKIINISSVLGRFGVPGYLAYCTSKHGVLGFTRSLALELAPFDIQVNAICPGWVDTEMARSGIRAMAKEMKVAYEEAKTVAMQTVPQHRMLDPDEVASLAIYLASPVARGITGQSFNIDCGQVMS